MAADISKQGVTKAYDLWAPVYDFVFGSVFEQGRNSAIAAANRVGGRVLEVGVGTGITLPLYSCDNRIVGIDLSDVMLRKARERVATEGLSNVEQLQVMDAEHLELPDSSFDVVVANHVISTVPHPLAALDECARVLRPGGEIILINRVGADQGLRFVVEKSLQPITRLLGWRTAFSWEVFGKWLEGRGDIRLLERLPVPPFGHFSLIRFAKIDAQVGSNPISPQMRSSSSGSRRGRT